MSRLSPQEKLTQKRLQLVTRTAEALGVTEVAARLLLSIPRQQSVRINTLNADTAVLAEMRQLGWVGEQYEWLPEGYSVNAGLVALRDSDLFKNGKIYIQNAASWLPVLALDPQPGDTILDVCAAPGGKTTHLTARAQNQAHITANDNSRPRLMKLQATCQRLDATIDRYTLFDARQLAHRLDGEQFDKILIDAPCSGEGMMHLDRNKDFMTWSLAQIKHLQSLQKRILNQAWRLLKPGGTLVYSTCTMAPEENEAVIDYVLRSLENVRLQPIELALQNKVATVQAWRGKPFQPAVSGCLRLQPSATIESFFVACLKKIA